MKANKKYISTKKMYEKENVDARSVIRLQFKFIFGHVLSAAVTLSYNV